MSKQLTKKDKNAMVWERNNALIKAIMLKIFHNEGYFPSIKELAIKCDLSEGTVSRHLKDIDFSELAGTAKLMTPKVIAKHYDKIMENPNANDLKLWYEFIAGANPQSQARVSVPIQINITTASAKDTSGAVEAEIVED